MAEVLPFKCWRPRPDVAAEVAATPYDTVSLDEVTRELEAHPLSFLRVDKPAALFEGKKDEYDPEVYRRARQELDAYFEQGIIVPDSTPLEPAYFVYRLTQGNHRQTGVLACVSVADYKNGVIKRHENTRAIKENDRVEHIKALEAHTGPVLLTYPSNEELDVLLASVTEQEPTLYDFVSPDGVRHEFWRVESRETENSIREVFAAIPALYIADGHHRAAAAVRVAENRPLSTDSQHFMALVVSSSEMQVLDYNRVVSDLGGLSAAELLEATGKVVDVELAGPEPYKPQARGEFGMYVDGQWYRLTLQAGERPDDVVERLDVALLHNRILEPLLGIDDPRSNPRIAYVGGIRGLEELACKADKTGGVAFALYPCSLDELFAVADAGRLMPPKSTWFEPKPRSGLAIHRITL